MKLTEQEKKKIIELIEAGKPLPSVYKSKLFDYDQSEFVEATKDYKIVYKGKARKEEIIARTPVAPFQKIRSFNADNHFEDGWKNMLIFGDNLMALKTLYEDQRTENKFKTKNKIKLIYIDPPFATKHDFMKDREKAYRDKIIGAQFIEFLRKRLILMREILADDGSIYVHLDWKKGHYIKAIMDEIFGEHNFINEIIWIYKEREMAKDQWNRKHDMIFYYKKLERPTFNYLEVLEDYRPETAAKFKYEDDKGLYQIRGKAIEGSPINKADGLRPEHEEKYPGMTYRQYMKGGTPPRDWWTIPIINKAASERLYYPTQKPEKLLERIVRASSRNNDIILDAFAGSGTTLAVAEKLGRRWIGMECGKLAIYTIQKRMLNLTSQIGSKKEDERKEYERVADLEDHSKSYSRGLLLVMEKARKGELNITDSFLNALANFLSRHIS